MVYRRCGASGLMLPAVSLGLWHNFGSERPYASAREMVLEAFDLGITHFDLANNYGTPAGSAEQTFGRILKEELHAYRDEIVVSTKAGYYMWPGPYGEWGSKKYLLASLDQSLMRMGLEYVDIFYHHRPDPETPLEESMDALATAVHQGKALYVGISSYAPEETGRASEILRKMGVKCLIHQPKYSMFSREPEDGLFEALKREQMGAIAFSPLAQGLLTNRYFSGIPKDSRAAGESVFLTGEQVDERSLAAARALHGIAEERGQSLSQMALAWCLRVPQMTSVIIGASRAEQIRENVKAVEKLTFTDDELTRIEQILG